MILEEAERKIECELMFQSMILRTLGGTSPVMFLRFGSIVLLHLAAKLRVVIVTVVMTPTISRSLIGLPDLILRMVFVEVFALRS